MKLTISGDNKFVNLTLGDDSLDLYSGNLYWPTTVNRTQDYPPLEDDINCDVLIIGGGSSGAQCAYYLSQFDIDVVVVDKRDVGTGSTSTNTALIQYSGDKMFFELINTFGEDRATRHLKLCEQAINDIESVAKELPVDCHFTRRDSLYFASTNEDVQKLDQEYALLKKHGFDVLYLDQEQVSKHYPFKTPAAIYSKNDGELNPLAFTYGLLEKAVSNGVRVFSHTTIKNKKFEKGQATFYTNGHHAIIAKHVIIAAGYEGLEFKKEKNADITSSYAIVTNPVEDFWYNRTLLWETARPYFYARTTHDNRIIFGGLDESTEFVDRRDSMLLHKRDQLVMEFNKLFPDIQIEPEYYLGAFYGGTHDGMPIIGMYDEYPQCYFLYGYGDNGTVYNMALAKIIRDIIVNNDRANLDLYIQTRPQL